MKRKTWIADLILLFVAIIWGTTFVLVENAIALLPPFLFNSIRFIFAALSLFIVLFFFYRRSLQAIDWKLIGAGVILGIWLFSGYLFQTVGLVYTTSSKAGFITGLSVVLVPIFAYFILKQRVSRNALLGSVVALFGLYLLTFSDISGMNIGDLLVLFCAISFALQIVLTGKYAPHYPTLVLAFIQISTVAVLSSIGALINGEWNIVIQRPAILLEPVIILAMLVCAILATAFAYVAQTELQKFTTPTKVALIFATEPVFATLTDIWWNGRWLSFTGVIGCLLILGGMILSELKWRGKQRATITQIEERQST
jgi:drug/metabolite transporter (DMT)-like permease